MNEYLMFSMPVVFCIVGMFCAVKKYAIFSRTSIITAIVFFFLNVYRPILNIVQLNRAGYDIHLDGDIIFSLSVMFGISVILYLFGYGLTVLIRNRQKNIIMFLHRKFLLCFSRRGRKKILTRKLFTQIETLHLQM